MERKYKYDIGKNKALSVNLMRSHSPQMKIDKIIKEILKKNLMHKNNCKNLQ